MKGLGEEYVRARTSVGPGPYSTPITEKTLEDVKVVFYILFKCYFSNVHFFSVPSSSPNNVTIISVSSTSIRVVWEDVQEIDENGVIMAFEILYIPLETFNEQLVSELVNTSASNRTISLNNLEEYVFYNISVRAYTSVGAGQFSSLITQRTSEDSKFCEVLDKNCITVCQHAIFYQPIVTIVVCKGRKFEQ